MTEIAKRDDYLAVGAHLGMREKTKQMNPYIFKIRSDGLCVLDVEKTDEKIDVAAKFLSRYDRIMVVCRKENGQKPAKLFSERVGAKPILGRFHPGTLTNPEFPGYFEPEIILLVDPLADRQGLIEGIKKRIPIIAMCDTYNDLDYIDLVIPVNNKGRKSVALVFYLLTREILKNREEIKTNEDFEYEPEDFYSSE